MTLTPHHDPAERLNAVARRIEDELKLRLRDAWASKLTKLDVETIRACCRDAADLHVRAMAAATVEEQQKLLREKAWIHAQLCNLVALKGTEAAAAFWDVVRTVVNGAVAVAFAAV